MNGVGEAFGFPVAERQGYLAEAFQKAGAHSRARRRTGSEIVAFVVRTCSRVACDPTKWLGQETGQNAQIGR